MHRGGYFPTGARVAMGIGHWELGIGNWELPIAHCPFSLVLLISSVELSRGIEAVLAGDLGRGCQECLHRKRYR